MSVAIEREEWVLSPLIYGFLLACCFLSVFLHPYFSRSGGAARTTTNASSLFDVGPTAPFLRFQRSFLLLYSLASGRASHSCIYLCAFIAMIIMVFFFFFLLNLTGKLNLCSDGGA